jgi:hypothetical protein
METTAEFQISTVGKESGTPYNGGFKVKTLLTRKDRFVADEHRRMTLGLNSATALDDLQLEAFMLGQLFVRIVDAPPFWKNSNNGADLPDGNVIVEIYNLAVAKESERKKSLVADAQAAVDLMAKQDPTA